MAKQLLFKRSGQATVEYLLLLVVIIVIGRVILTPLGKGLRDFSGSFVGPDGYYACLMENGLLPGFDRVEGVNSQLNCGNLKKNAADTIEVYSLDGLNAAGSSSQSGQSGEQKRNISKAPTEKEKDASDQFTGSKTKKGNSRSRSSAHARAGSGGGEQAGFGRHKIKRKKRKKRSTKIRIKKPNFENEFKASKKKININEEVGEESFKTTQAIVGKQYKKEEKKRKKTRLFSGVGKGKKAEEEEARKKQARLIKERRNINTEEGMEINADFSFEKFLKYFILAALILAILFIIFSQVMEFQSRE